MMTNSRGQVMSEKEHCFVGTGGCDDGVEREHCPTYLPTFYLADLLVLERLLSVHVSRSLVRCGSRSSPNIYLPNEVVFPTTAFLRPFILESNMKADNFSVVK